LSSKEAGAVLALARWGPMEGHNSSWGGGAGRPQYAAELRILLYFAAELRILLSLGRLGENGGGATGATFFIGGPRPPWFPVEPPL